MKINTLLSILAFSIGSMTMMSCATTSAPNSQPQFAVAPEAEKAPELPFSERTVAQVQGTGFACSQNDRVFREALTQFDACNSRGGLSCNSFCSITQPMAGGSSGIGGSVPPGFVSEAVVLSRIDSDLSLVVRGNGFTRGFGRSETECVENALANPSARDLVDRCNFQATYVKRCGLVALPGASVAPIAKEIFSVGGAVNKKNCGGPNSPECGRPLCQADIQRNLSNRAAECRNQYGVPCDAQLEGEIIHSYRDGSYRCQASASLLPQLQGGVSCNVNIEARNGAGGRFR